jgi:WD40 repeat protein
MAFSEITSAPAFYVTGGTLPPEAPSYIQRQADEELFDTLRAGETAYVLNARQMGKSSLCVRTLQRLNAQGIHTAFLDLTRYGGSNLSVEQWYAALLSDTGRALGLRAEFLAYAKQNLDVGPMQRYFAALREVALTRLPGRIVLFVDEIDVTRSLAFSTDEFFAGIRQCYVSRAADPELNRLCFCLLGTATPTDLIRNIHITPFNIGKRIELRDFSSEEASPLASGLGPSGSRKLERILYWTGGHPYLTQRLCRAVAESEDEDVDRLCNDLFLSHRARESDDNLAFVRNRLLKTEGDLAALLTLYQRVWEGRRIPDDDTDPLRDILKLSGIVRVEQGRLLVRNRIYSTVFDRDWVRQHLPDADLRRQEAAYRRGLFRALAVSGAVLSAVLGLTVFAFSQADRAQKNEELAKRNAATAQLNETREAIARKDAENSAQEAERQRRIAAGNARKERKARTEADRERRRADAKAAEATAALNAARTQKNLADRRAGEAAHNLTLANERLREIQVANQGREAALKTARQNAALAQRRADEAAQNLYFANMALIPNHWVRHNTTRVRQLLAETESYPGRGFEWDYWNHQCRLDLKTLSFPKNISAAIYSPDGKYILFGGDEIDVRDRDSLALLRTFKDLPGELAFQTLSRDSRYLAASCWNGTARVWDFMTGQVLCTLSGYRNAVYCIAFSPDGSRVATSSLDGTAHVWETVTGKKLLTLEGHSTRGIPSVTFSHDGRFLVTGGFDGKTIVRDAEAGKALRVLPTSMRSVSFSPDGKYLAGSRLHSVVVWDTTEWKEVREFQAREVQGTAETTNDVYSVVFSPDGKYLASGGYNNAARVWDIERGEEILTLKGHARDVFCIRYSPDGGHLITVSADKTVKIWDARRRRDAVPISTGLDQVNGLWFAQDGRLALFGSKNGTPGIWAAESREETSTSLAASGNAARITAVSPKGRLLITATVNNAVPVWDASTGKLRFTLKGHTARITSLTFSEDESRIVTGSIDGTARVWDARTGECLQTLRGHDSDVLGVAFSARTHLVATAGRDATARIWDSETGKQLQVLRGHTLPLLAVRFSPDGEHVVTASFDRTAKVWNTRTGMKIWELEGHTNRVTTAAFSPDGKRIVTGSFDKTVRVWDMATGRETLTLPPHAVEIVAATFSPDGTKIATLDAGGNAWLWLSKRTGSSPLGYCR